MKILICGGGIAGNALAFWLAKAGNAVTVVERSPSLRSTGLQLDLRGHGVEVLRRTGLEQAFRARTVHEQGLQLVDKTGKVRAYFPANRTGKGLQSFTTDFEIMRGDFVQLLHDASKDRVKYIFGTTIESFEQNEESISVSFSDGGTECFDMLVGADGQGSRTRKMMLGSSLQDPIHYLGQYVAYFTCPRELQPDEDYVCTSYIATNRRGLMIRRHDPHRVQVYMSCESAKLKSVPRGDVEQEKAVMAEIFEGAGWQASQLVKALQIADDFYLERPGVVKLESWSKDRIALVGDAAYCPTANTGMGTTSSFVGAYVLAGEIVSKCAKAATQEDIRIAFAEYERKFRPFMGQVQRAIAEEEHDWFMPTTPFGIAIFNFLVGIAASLRLDLLSRFVLRENVKDWALPDYEALTSV